MIFEKQIINMYKGMAYTRCDDNNTAYYFSADDFKGLNSEPYDFDSSRGHRLKGHLYSYDDPISKRIIVFDHGFGGGHRSYMKEIEKLAAHGYLVLAYDHTGCMESGGSDPNGMAQSLCDLNDCISAIKADPRFSGYDISVMGHSWGGFSTLNISAIHQDISKIVVLSGFVSVKRLIDSYFSGIMKGYRKVIMRLEEEANPHFITYDAVESLRSVSTRALLIYSDNDRMCTRAHYDALYNGLKDRDNITFMLTHKKGHNPNYTLDAVEYLGRYIKDKSRLMRNGRLTTDDEKRSFVSSYDWDRMTMQDETVWDKIFNHFD